MKPNRGYLPLPLSFSYKFHTSFLISQDISHTFCKLYPAPTIFGRSTTQDTFLFNWLTKKQLRILNTYFKVLTVVLTNVWQEIKTPHYVTEFLVVS